MKYLLLISLFWCSTAMAFITWNEGVKEVSFDAETEDWQSVGVNGGIVSGDAVGSMGTMYTGYIPGKSGVIILDKKTGAVKRKYGTAE